MVTTGSWYDRASGASVGELELVAAFFGVLNVALLSRANAWGFVAGFVMGGLYVVVFHEARLYADVGFQALYASLQLRGLVLWRRGATRSAPAGPIVRATRGELWRGVLAAGLCAAVLGATLTATTDAALPYADSVAVTYALLAQVWLNRRRLENWIAWVLVDLWAVGVYLAKQLYPTAVLFAVFAVLSAYGWWRWRQMLVVPTKAGHG